MKEWKEILKNIEIFIENFGKPVILQTDNGKEFDNQYLKTYCADNDIKLINSSPYHNFNIEDALFKIIKIHNNKIHSTTKRIPKDIRDISDEKEINLIKKEIFNTLEKKIRILAL